MRKFILSKTKILLSVLALVCLPAVAAASLSPVLDTASLYQIANTSLSADWGTSTSADPGQTLTFLVHIHNTVYNTTANNVNVQVVLPTGPVTSYTSRVLESADNASSIAGTTSFTVSSPSTIDYIPGSTVLYDHNDKVIGTLPDTITTSGVTVGNIQGCYNYEEWIMFKAKVNSPVYPKPACELTATPTSIVSGGSSSLSWSVENASSFVLNQGIGNVNASGSLNVSPTSSTTYTGTVTGNGGEATCTATVSVTTPTTPVTPVTPSSPSLPVTGPTDGILGILGTVGLGGAGYTYKKSKARLANSFRKF